MDYCSLRAVRETREFLGVRSGIPIAPQTSVDEGAMVTVMHRGGRGYAASSDLSADGIYYAIGVARRWAELGASPDSGSGAELAHSRGAYESVESRPWGSLPRSDKLALLVELCGRLRDHRAITDCHASLARSETETRLFTSGGGDVRQVVRRVHPQLSATASDGSRAQTRTGGRTHLRQGGLEVLDAVLADSPPERLAAEAVALLDAEDCPTGRMDLILGPAQMAIQVHESIGHALELDRILRDERNYGGGSFVHVSDFGALRIGSEALTVVFDPGVPGEAASYAFDCEGTPAARQVLIERGVLIRGLGGARSQARLGVSGTAGALAASWNRPAIDRMGNLNLEPGDASAGELVRSVERGVYMDDYRSWSIDDRRDRFQFGCEWGRRIEDGALGALVRTPGYSGTTLAFWRKLARVGDAATVRVLGTPNCGKGEPNQLHCAGHAVPSCLFRDVDVLGAKE